MKGPMRTATHEQQSVASFSSSFLKRPRWVSVLQSPVFTIQIGESSFLVVCLHPFIVQGTRHQHRPSTDTETALASANDASPESYLLSETSWDCFADHVRVLRSRGGATAWAGLWPRAGSVWLRGPGRPLRRAGGVHADSWVRDQCRPRFQLSSVGPTQKARCSSGPVVLPGPTPCGEAIKPEDGNGDSAPPGTDTYWTH